MLEKVRKHRRIDKSVLTFGEPVRVRDRAFLDHQGTRACARCGARDGTVVGAHVRSGNEGGTSLKPSDDLSAPLCHTCHMEQEANPGPLWWFENVLKPMLRSQYESWKLWRKRQ